MPGDYIPPRFDANMFHPYPFPMFPAIPWQFQENYMTAWCPICSQFHPIYDLAQKVLDAHEPTPFMEDDYQFIAEATRE